MKWTKEMSVMTILVGVTFGKIGLLLHCLSEASINRMTNKSLSNDQY